MPGKGKGDEEDNMVRLIRIHSVEGEFTDENIPTLYLPAVSCYFVSLYALYNHHVKPFVEGTFIWIINIENPSVRVLLLMLVFSGFLCLLLQSSSQALCWGYCYLSYIHQEPFRKGYPSYPSRIIYGGYCYLNYIHYISLRRVLSFKVYTLYPFKKGSVILGIYIISI